VRTLLWRYAIGFFAVTIPMVVGLAALGALPSALSDVLVFPLRVYPTGNRTRYAFDVGSRLSRWRSAPLTMRTALRIVIYGVVTLPLVGLGAALAVGGLRLWRVARGHASPPSPFARRLLIAAALAAPFVPVALSKTRSDVCHIGFVLATTLLVLVALGCAPQPRARALSALRFGLRGLVALLLLGGATVWLHNATAKYERLPRSAIEPRVAQIWGADLLAALTDPGDRVFVAPLGGVHYLLSRRDNATSYNLLVSSAYSAAQWPLAAAEVVERKPRVIHTFGRGYFQRLVNERPQIAQLYTGSDLHYFLKGRAGPGLELPVNFSGRIDRREITLTLEGTTARVNGGEPKPMSLDGNVVSVFQGPQTWVGRLSPDGKRLAGRSLPDGLKFDLARQAN
jgi:hypothetical protein